MPKRVIFDMAKEVEDFLMNLGDLSCVDEFLTEVLLDMGEVMGDWDLWPNNVRDFIKHKLFTYNYSEDSIEGELITTAINGLAEAIYRNAEAHGLITTIRGNPVFPYHYMKMVGTSPMFAHYSVAKESF